MAGATSRAADTTRDIMAQITDIMIVMIIAVASGTIDVSGVIIALTVADEVTATMAGTATT